MSANNGQHNSSRLIDYGSLERIYGSRLAASTDKQSSSLVLAFARDHGYKGRIFARTVIPTVALSCRGNTMDGFCFEPQDSNELLSAVASMFAENDAGEIEKLADQVPDPAGTFYKYGLAQSLLRRRR